MPGAGDKLLPCSTCKVVDAQGFPRLIPGNGLPAVPLIRLTGGASGKNSLSNQWIYQPSGRVSEIGGKITSTTDDSPRSSWKRKSELACGVALRSGISCWSPAAVGEAHHLLAISERRPLLQKLDVPGACLEQEHQ